LPKVAVFYKKVADWLPKVAVFYKKVADWLPKVPDFRDFMARSI
jgi:hypothetical protein